MIEPRRISGVRSQHSHTAEYNRLTGEQLSSEQLRDKLKGMTAAPCPPEPERYAVTVGWVQVLLRRRNGNQFHILRVSIEPPKVTTVVTETRDGS